MKNNIIRIIASAAALIMLSGCSRAAEENIVEDFSGITSSAEVSEASENEENIEESGKETVSDGSENIQCIMIYQSMSGDAEQGEAYFETQGGSISSLSGDMFYVTNTACEINIKNVEFSQADGYFLNASGNDSSRGWGKQGENGANVKLNAEEQTIEGDIFVDSISSLELDLSSSTLK